MQRFVPGETRIRPVEFNGQPGFIAYSSGRPLTALVFEIRGGRIGTISAIGNPDTLRPLPEPP